MEFNNLKAALFVVIAMSLITTNDAIVKHITQVFNVGQIIFLRGALICVIFAIVMRVRRQPVFNRQTLHRWNLLRGLFELAATLMFMTGLSLLPIAVASTLGFSSPIFLALLAGVILKEEVGLERWIIILVGFGGVMLITNPFAESTSWAMVFPIICAFFVALRDIAIRYVPHDIPLLASCIYQCLDRYARRWDLFYLPGLGRSGPGMVPVVHRRRRRTLLWLPVSNYR